MLQLWLVERNEYIGWDEYDASVIAAADKEAALDIGVFMGRRENLTITHIGTAIDGTPAGRILDSFNAG